MKLVEPVEHLQLLLPTHYFLYPCGDHPTVLRELSIVKPPDQLAKLGDYWDNQVIRCCIEEPAKCSEHEFLSHCRCTLLRRWMGDGRTGASRKYHFRAASLDPL
jgi:hypothetical protein